MQAPGPTDPAIQLSLQQPTQELNNIVRNLGELLQLFKEAARETLSIGHNAAGASGTAFTAVGHQIVVGIQVSSTSAADAVTINWVDSSAGTTHNIITDGVIGAAYPLYALGFEIALDDGDTITYTGGDADMDFIITYREDLL